MAIYTLPKLDDVARVLGMLLNKPVTAATAQPLSNPSIAGTYIDRKGDIGALCLVDVAFAAYAGAALTMIPCDVANDEIRTRRLSSEILENLQEVFNVMVAFFNQGDVPHIRFADMLTTPAEFPADFDNLDHGGARRVDLGVTIEGYGAGAMCLCTH